MKKLILILFFSFFAISFAKNPVTTNEKASMDKNMPDLYICHTSCGTVAGSYSYETVSPSQIIAWCEAMDEFYCEAL